MELTASRHSKPLRETSGRIAIGAALAFCLALPVQAQDVPPPPAEVPSGKASVSDDPAIEPTPALPQAVQSDAVDEEFAVFEAIFNSSGTDAAAAGRQPADSMTWMSGEAPLTCGEGCVDFSQSAEFARRWNLTLISGYEYDTNVPLAPTFTGLGSGADLSDSRWINSIVGDYRLIQDDDWTLGVTASGLNATQFSLDQYDLQGFSGGMYSNLASGDWLYSAYYTFSKTYLDQNDLATSHRLSGSVSLLGEEGHMTAFYEFENLELDALALIPAQDRSGSINSGGFTKAWYLYEGLGRIFVGYRFDDADTDGTDFSMESHSLNARIETPLSLCEDSWLSTVIFDAGARHFWDDYEHSNSLDFLERTRTDRRIEVRTGLQKFLTEHMSLRLDYTYVDSDSNVRNLFDVGFYSFQRHVFSSQLIYDF